MEKIRIFERKCIRACLSIYRSEYSGYKKYVKNKKIYDLVNIHHIDCHILKLTRNHFAQAAKIKENSLIFGYLFPNDSYYKNTLITGYISPPPRSFSIPRRKKLSPRSIIYHIKRKIGIKSILYEENLDGRTADIR